MRHLAAIVLCAFLPGLVATWIAGQSVAERRQVEIQQALDSRAELVADETAQLLSEAITTTERIDRLALNAWPSPAEYTRLVNSFEGVIVGDWFAAQMVAVLPKDLDAMAAAERRETPNFEVSFLRDVPLDIGHIMLLRSSRGEPDGADISSYPGVGQSLAAMEVGVPTFAGADVRKPGAQAPGQLQVQHRSMVVGPAGQLADGWSVVQIDAAALFAQALPQTGDPYGAEFALSVNPDAGGGGIARSQAVSEITIARNVGDLTITSTVWTDGSDVGGIDEQTIYAIGALLTAGLAAVVAAGLLIRSLRRRAGRSDVAARRDPLTGLRNRRWLMEHLDEQHGQPVGVLFCDLDRFKVVNDRAGHSIGDELLVAVGERIESALLDGSSCVRFGGDEFIVVCHPTGSNPLRTSTEIADRLVEAMSEPFVLSTGELRTTLSIGVAAAEAEENTSGTELIRSADVALGHCKQSGRNSWVVYDAAFRDAEQDRVLMENELQLALDTGDLAVHYQPIVTALGEPTSFEALVRWERSGDGLVSPAVFLPVISDIDRMSDLGEIVLRKAIAGFAAATGDKPWLTIHVNVDPSQLSDAAFPDLVERILAEHGLDPRRLILELVEDEWLDLAVDTEEVLQRLAALGLGLSVDDFGTGYSSTARILRVPGLVEIKIDRSLSSTVEDPRTEAFIAGMADTARRLDVQLTAEGVETIDELHALRRAGVDHFQGFLFARPAAEIVTDRVGPHRALDDSVMRPPALANPTLATPIT